METEGEAMESEREEYLRRIFEVVEGERRPGFGIVISLKSRKERREARARDRSKRLAQLSGRENEPDRKK